MVVAFHLSAQVEHPRSRTQIAYDQIRADLFGLFVCLLAVGRRNDPATLHQDRSEEQTELRIVDGDQNRSIRGRPRPAVAEDSMRAGTNPEPNSGVKTCRIGLPGE